MHPARRRAITTLAIIIVLAIVAAIALAIHLARQPDQTHAEDRAAATSSSSSTANNASAARTSGPASSAATPSAQAVNETAGKFLAAYTTTTGDKNAWIAGLAPITTPTMLASLRSSDPAAANSLAGASLTAPQGDTVEVSRDGRTLATIHLSQDPVDEEEGGDPATAPYSVTGLDFAKPPADTALPLTGDAAITLGQTIQPAMAALIAQPGGLTDADRATQIASAFTTPTNAQTIPRLGTEDQRIVVGNVQDAQIGTDDQGNLTVTATMPWQIDGTPDVQWASHTITLGRTPLGQWTAVDAT